jgi:hypothetical protein
MNDRLISMLNAVGQKCFVDYYLDFREQTAFEVLPDNYTAKSKKSRQTHANWIFRNDRERDALRYIIDIARVDQETKNTARELLDQELR